MKECDGTSDRQSQDIVKLNIKLSKQFLELEALKATSCLLADRIVNKKGLKNKVEIANLAMDILTEYGLKEK